MLVTNGSMGFDGLRISVSPTVAFPLLKAELQDRSMQKAVRKNNPKGRNRKRSKRRHICCSHHGCLVTSTSPKYPLYGDRPEHLNQRGMGRTLAKRVMAAHTTVLLKGEWLERFWCDDCDTHHWYHVQETAPRCYEVRLAPAELWRQVPGVMDPLGNPSVGEFTRRQSKTMSHKGLQDFQGIE